HRFPELAALVDALAARGARRRLGEIIAGEVAAGSLEVADPVLAADLLAGMIVHRAVSAGLLGRKSVAATQPAQWVEMAVSVFLDGCRSNRNRLDRK
ncbi:MAG: TetR/AcrR family transcriptional regulator C-terminal domain-containing protein, partial [Acetobacteraceae bacterium]